MNSGLMRAGGVFDSVRLLRGDQAGCAKEAVYSSPVTHIG